MATPALDAVGNTPLVELEALAPDEGPSIYVKCEGMNPTGSMKDRMAVAMIRSARREGTLAPGQHIVEQTGGSTGSSLAFVAATLDHPATFVTADCFAEEKIQTMRAFGADVTVLETPTGEFSPDIFEEMTHRAEEIATETAAYRPDQYTNMTQLDGYEQLGREILEDCPDITHFVMAVGTGGCAMGTAQTLKPEADVTVTLVEPDESAYLSRGERGNHDIEGVGLGYQPALLDASLYDDVETVPEAAALDTARRLTREDGIFAGKSTGLNVAAAVRMAEDLDQHETIVTVACDTGLKYLSGSLYGGGA